MLLVLPKAGKNTTVLVSQDFLSDFSVNHQHINQLNKLYEM